MDKLRIGELFGLLKPRILGLMRERGGMYVALTAPATHSAWDGDSKTNANNGALNVNTLWGVPSTARAVHVQMSVGSTTVGAYANLGYSSTHPSYVGQVVQHASYINVINGMVTVNNGTVYFSCGGAGATVTVYIRVLGYFI